MLVAEPASDSPTNHGLLRSCSCRSCSRSRCESLHLVCCRPDNVLLRASGLPARNRLSHRAECDLHVCAVCPVLPGPDMRLLRVTVHILPIPMHDVCVTLHQLCTMHHMCVACRDKLENGGQLRTRGSRVYDLCRADNLSNRDDCRRGSRGSSLHSSEAGLL